MTEKEKMLLERFAIIIPKLTEEQKERFISLGEAGVFWNGEKKEKQEPVAV